MGIAVGAGVGMIVGLWVGVAVGAGVGIAVGDGMGIAVGAIVGQPKQQPHPASPHRPRKQIRPPAAVQASSPTYHTPSRSVHDFWKSAHGQQRPVVGAGVGHVEAEEGHVGANAAGTRVLPLRSRTWTTLRWMKLR